MRSCFDSDQFRFTWIKWILISAVWAAPIAMMFWRSWPFPFPASSYSLHLAMHTHTRIGIYIKIQKKSSSICLCALPTFGRSTCRCHTQVHPHTHTYTVVRTSKCNFMAHKFLIKFHGRRCSRGSGDRGSGSGGGSSRSSLLTCNQQTTLACI